jgi:hypothetical protein
MAIDLATWVIDDARFGAPVVFVSLPRSQVNYFKVLLESYEGIAAFRTQIPEHEPGRALVAVLIAPSFVAAVASVLEETVADADVRLRRPSAADLDKLHGDLTSGTAEDPD